MQDYDVDADVERQFPKIWATLLAENLLTPQSTPVAVLLGGQPGAGKSFGSLEMSKRLDFNVLFINGDEFRAYHQHYEEICQQYGKDSPKYTAEFAGKMVQKVRNEAIAHRFNMIIEGTFRTTETPLQELSNFKQHGYRTMVLICTCPTQLSWQSTIKRAEEQQAKGLPPRYVAREHYDLVVENLAKNTETVFKIGQPERLEVYSRSQKLFDSDCQSIEDVVQIINQELYRIEEIS